MKMMMGSTWKAKMTPTFSWGVPKARCTASLSASFPKTKALPTLAYPNSAATALLMARSTWLNGVLSTSNAKANCKPSPQATVRNRMDRLWLEHSQANARMTTRPRNPV